MRLARAEADRCRAAYLMAAAGHDLRQPLQVIVLALDRVTRGVSCPQQLEWLRIAIGEVFNLSAGLTDLAWAARLSEPHVTLLSLTDVLASAESWRHHAAARGLELRILGTRRRVWCDAHLLTTIVRNLVGNAVKHTRRGGVLVGCRPHPDGVRIEVIDTGPGLPDGRLARLFEPHLRGETNVEGLGLGLAIVRDAVERLGADLTVRTVPGRGSRFSLVLPETQRSPTQVETPRGRSFCSHAE